MTTSPHQLPGRLRLRFPQLKRDIFRLRAVSADLLAVTGVVKVEESPIIGSILIHYEAATGRSRIFWDAIEAILLAHQLTKDYPYPKQVMPPPAVLGRVMVERLSDTLVDKVIQRSAVALVAALL